MNKNTTEHWKKFDLSFPIVAILALFIYSFLFNHKINPDTQFFLKAFVLSVLFNTTHIGYTFTTVFFLPETKQWQVGRFGSERNFRNLFLLFCLFWVPVLAFSKGVFNGNVSSPLGLHILTFAGLVSLWHNFAQSMGMSLSYNRHSISSNESSTNKTLIREKAQFEKRAVLVYFLLKGFFLFFVRPQFPFFKEPDVAKTMLLGELTIVSYFIFKVSNWTGASEKKLFGIRYLAWPFLGYIYLAPLVIQAVHGIEYMFVQSKMINNSTIKPEPRKRLKYANIFWLSLFFFFGLFDMGSIGGFLAKKDMFNFSLLNILSSVSFGLFMVHVMVDSVLYRFRDPTTRLSIGKLL